MDLAARELAPSSPAPADARRDRGCWGIWGVELGPATTTEPGNAPDTALMNPDPDLAAPLNRCWGDGVARTMLDAACSPAPAAAAAAVDAAAEKLPPEVASSMADT